MILNSILANWLTWSMQVLILSGVGCVLPRLLQITDPKSRLLGAQFTLLACLILPFGMPRMERSGHVSTDIAQDLTGSIPGRRIPIQQPGKWSYVIPGVLAAGALLRISGLLAGMWKLRGYRRATQPLSREPDDAFALTGTRCRVALGDRANSPATFGLLKPIVLLPESFLALSSEAQLAILCHELLHVRRNDWLAALAEEFTGALLWFQPAVYILIADIRLAREQVVDRRVVELTRAKTPYVEALLAVASEPFGAALAMAPQFLHRRNLKSRVTFLLEELYMSKTKMVLANVSLAALLGTAGWVSSVTFPLVAVAQEKQAPKNGVTVAQNEVENYDFSKAFAPATGPRLRIGGNAIAKNLIRQVKPAYPPEAKDARLQGKVRLGILVGTDGHVTDLVLISGPAPLVQPSSDAVRQWVYRPTLLNGEPVEVVSVVDVNFTLAP
jgi:hypothetical protein